MGNGNLGMGFSFVINLAITSIFLHELSDNYFRGLNLLGMIFLPTLVLSCITQLVCMIKMNKKNTKRIRVIYVISLFIFFPLGYFLGLYGVTKFDEEHYIPEQ